MNWMGGAKNRNISKGKYQKLREQMQRNIHKKKIAQMQEKKDQRRRGGRLSSSYDFQALKNAPRMLSSSTPASIRDPEGEFPVRRPAEYRGAKIGSREFSKGPSTPRAAPSPLYSSHKSYMSRTFGGRDLIDEKVEDRADWTKKNLISGAGSFGGFRKRNMRVARRIPEEETADVDFDIGSPLTNQPPNASPRITLPSHPSPRTTLNPLASPRNIPARLASARHRATHESSFKKFCPNGHLQAESTLTSRLPPRPKRAPTIDTLGHRSGGALNPHEDPENDGHSCETRFEYALSLINELQETISGLKRELGENHRQICEIGKGTQNQEQQIHENSKRIGQLYRKERPPLRSFEPKPCTFSVSPSSHAEEKSPQPK
eukprot:914176-Amorphochlora_amoeboformis.AAC.1